MGATSCQQGQVCVTYPGREGCGSFAGWVIFWRAGTHAGTHTCTSKTAYNVIMPHCFTTFVSVLCPYRHNRLAVVQVVVPDSILMAYVDMCSRDFSLYHTCLAPGLYCSSLSVFLTLCLYASRRSD